MSNPTTRGRARRFTGLAAAFVAVLAGVAVAYFLTAQNFAGNNVTSGELTVDSTLATAPLDFGGNDVYPTNGDGGDDPAVVNDEFDITNNNSVPVEYKITATCGTTVPTDCDFTDADSDDRADDPAARQFNELQIEIYQPFAATPDNDQPADVPGDCNDLEDALQRCGTPAGRNVYYHGPLSELSSEDLKTIAEGDSENFQVDLWLKNDPDHDQTQQQLTEFVLTVEATTPVA